MEQEAEAPILTGLSDSDLLGLRLAAQVMTHKAELVGRGPVAAYFARLEHSVQAELASRLTGIRALSGQLPLEVDQVAGGDDIELINEYLEVLIANEQLSGELRDACRRLRARNTEAGPGA
ncbi:hypothetical protein BH24CHL6_BH24CHL6_15160 [soil metagenome]